MQSPPGRRARRSRRGDPGADQWLELPGWRRPLDALLVLAVAFSAAWIGLVVIPAAAHDSQATIAGKSAGNVRHADSPATHESADPSTWMAGPVYTGAPAAPSTQATTGVDVVAAPAAETPAPAPRLGPKRTTQAVPRTTAPRPPAPRTTVPRKPTPTVARVVAAVTPAPPATSEAPASSAPPVTSASETIPPTSSGPETTTSSEPPAPTSSETTTPAP